MIYVIDGQDARRLIRRLAEINAEAPIEKIEFYPQQNGIAIKIDGGMWSAPIGRPKKPE